MKIALQAVAASVLGVTLFGAALFLPAWTLHYWQAWVFIGVFSAATLVPTGYLAVEYPAALQRRLRGGPVAETRPIQRIVISATMLSVVALLAISALDHRFGWSSVPLPLVVFGNALVAVGLIVAQLVVIQNGYAAATIVVEVDQPLVSSGLYAVVRHPMYLGALIMMTGTPLALDSYWGLGVLPLAMVALAARNSDEEKMLARDLAGYGDHVQRTRYRLLPGVW